MLSAVLNKSREAAPHKTAGVRSLTSHFTNRPSKRSKICWKSKDGLISGVLLWTPAHGHTRVNRPAKIYIYQPCADIVCRLEDFPRAIRQRERERERGREGSVLSTRLDDDDDELSFSTYSLTEVLVWHYELDICTYMYTHVCVCTHTSVRVCVCMCVYVCVRPRVPARAHMYTHIYMWRDELDSAWVSNFKC